MNIEDLLIQQLQTDAKEMLRNAYARNPYTLELTIDVMATVNNKTVNIRVAQNEKGEQSMNSEVGEIPIPVVDTLDVLNAPNHDTIVAYRGMQVGIYLKCEPTTENLIKYIVTDEDSSIHVMPQDDHIILLPTKVGIFDVVFSIGKATTKIQLDVIENDDFIEYLGE